MDEVEGKVQAFSLVELLVVIGILAILITMALPSFQSAARGLRIESAGQAASEAMRSARDLALARNCQMEVRLIKVPGDSGGELFRGIQVWLQQSDGTVIPASRPTYLPAGTAIMEGSQFSPALDSTNVQGTMTLVGANRLYRGVRLGPDGALKPRTTNALCLTVVAEQDRTKSTLPANFRAITCNPVTGEVGMFRP